MRDQVVLATRLIEDLLELRKSIDDLLNGRDTNDASGLSANKETSDGSDTRERTVKVGVKTEAIRATPHVFAIHLAKGLIARTLGPVELADQVEVGVDVDILPEGVVHVAAGPDADLQLDVGGSILVPGTEDGEEARDASSELEIVVHAGLVQERVVADIAFISFKLDTEPDVLHEVSLATNVAVESPEIGSSNGDVAINLLLKEPLPFLGDERIVRQVAARVFFQDPFIDLQAKLIGHVAPADHLGYGPEARLPGTQEARSVCTRLAGIETREIHLEVEGSSSCQGLGDERRSVDVVEMIKDSRGSRNDFEDSGEKELCPRREYSHLALKVAK